MTMLKAVHCKSTVATWSRSMWLWTCLWWLRNAFTIALLRRIVVCSDKLNMPPCYLQLPITHGTPSWRCYRRLILICRHIYYDIVYKVQQRIAVHSTDLFLFSRPCITTVKILADNFTTGKNKQKSVHLFEKCHAISWMDGSGGKFQKWDQAQKAWLPSMVLTHWTMKTEPKDDVITFIWKKLSNATLAVVERQKYAKVVGYNYNNLRKIFKQKLHSFKLISTNQRTLHFAHATLHSRAPQCWCMIVNTQQLITIQLILDLPCFGRLSNGTAVRASWTTAVTGTVCCQWFHTCFTASWLWPMEMLTL